MKEKLDFSGTFGIIKPQRTQTVVRCYFLKPPVLFARLVSGGDGMFRRRSKPVNKKLLFIRVYVSVLTLILAASVMALVTQSVRARAATECTTRTDSVTVHYHGQTMKTTGNG